MGGGLRRVLDLSYHNRMCGRFSFLEPARVAEAFHLDPPVPVLTPRYNASPGQAVAVIALKRDAIRRGLALLQWGLVPSWSPDPRRGPRPINARSDSLDKPTFRDAFRGKRCLIPADGFYEWAKAGTGKRATHFRMKDAALFAFAGLWEFWTDGAQKLATCCIITTDANAVVAPLHDRMPVILPESAHDPWLANDTTPADLRALLRPYPLEPMEAAPVGPAVNSPRNDGPECLAPPPAETPGLF